ncbi:MAG: hypothetical protein V1901_04335 [Patescibacteria group bacterium]
MDKKTVKVVLSLKEYKPFFNDLEIYNRFAIVEIEKANIIAMGRDSNELKRICKKENLK